MSGLVSGPAQPVDPRGARRNILSGGPDAGPGQGRPPGLGSAGIVVPPLAASVRLDGNIPSARNDLLEEPLSRHGDLLAGGGLEAVIGGGPRPVTRISEASLRKAPTMLAQAAANQPNAPRPSEPSGAAKVSRKSRSPAGRVDEPGALLGGEGLIFNKSDESGKVRKMGPAILDAGPPTKEVIDEFAMFKKLDFDLNGPTNLEVIANIPVAAVRAQSVIGETRRIRERLFPGITPHGNKGGCVPTRASQL